MLYWLSEIFHINLLGYITIRAGIAFFLALFFTLYLLPRFIRWAQRTSSVQPINSWAPERHQGKAKTPTMGGIVFIFSTILASLITIKFSNIYALGAILTLFLFVLIGFKDDYAKIKKNENLAGLKARTKLFLQIVSAIAIAMFLYIAPDFNTDLYIPFIKNPVCDMGGFSVIFWVLVIIATSNAVNLTDGLDGLATVPSIIALTSFSIIIYITGNAVISSYLLMPNINIGEVAIVSSALIGALTGFLWYNCHPAEIFMGDSGSLTLGAFLGYLAIISKSEILLLLIGSIFVIETLSVILQVGSYKLRKKRVFLMAPIHHHFEMKHWAENKIIVRFWIIAILSNIVALISLKIR
ncbi:phospho-N-acetylmuramoyl-pentapeptide-transferase [Sulfurimonas sp.]|uniref:phospho-N-acetylmuramoyl-pentapeptide- transferase n=1 Tax=Sulfurimonas sp. TaxID=2022749 RepID=UPI001A0A4613|nr:phospho-N-acetylmuramoyl-pentapeptide-transferase [Sulfurimonas sp.]MBE0515641.1 phospho-N-acetylmuramoyl-pentapeptide-transferase [Sulfurimonas sp.]